ncbi:trehalose-phosphatase [Aestuariibius sp. 2305UL40-4]|uniref:trehalose-phosphatase n=1 Tax=Aestuariibius violaceus TaxID=3234132 RepID=UPI00345F150F
MPAAINDAPNSDEIPDLDPDRSALFLDFDGTLVDLVDTPDGVSVPPDLSGLLDRLHAALSGRLALVSGRPIKDLDSFLPGFPGPVVGGHGAEIRVNGSTERHPFAGSDAFTDIRIRATRIAEDHPGTLLEEKATGFGVHYRRNPADQPALEQALQAIIADHDDLELHQAKMALEIKPASVNKGAATRTLMDHFSARHGIFMGDDASDEAGIEEVQSNGGFGIKIGDAPTVARHRLPDPVASRALLKRWHITLSGAETP